MKVNDTNKVVKSLLIFNYSSEMIGKKEEKRTLPVIVQLNKICLEWVYRISEQT